MNALRYAPSLALSAWLLAACGAAPAPTDAAQPPMAPTPAAGNASPGMGDPGRYTSLDAGACRVIKEYEETGGTISRCPGIGGFELAVQDLDARMSIDVIAPDGATTPLHLVTLVGNGAFSSLGPRAEWRLGGDGRPAALIARFNVYEHPERPDHPTSYLVVARLGGRGTCVVAKLPPTADQNARAREMADVAAEAPCLRRTGAG